QFTYYPGPEERTVLQYGLVHHNLDPSGLDALHHPLNGRRAEIIRAGFHHQAINAHYTRIAPEDRSRDEVLARAVRIDNGADQIAGYFVVVGQQLARVLGQAVPAVAERRIVVMIAD